MAREIMSRPLPRAAPAIMPPNVPGPLMHYEQRRRPRWVEIAFVAAFLAISIFAVMQWGEADTERQLKEQAVAHNAELARANEALASEVTRLKDQAIEQATETGRDVVEALRGVDIAGLLPLGIIIAILIIAVSLQPQIAGGLVAVGAVIGLFLWGMG